jgi:hypothetical protein
VGEVVTTLLDLIDVVMPERATAKQRFERFNEVNPKVLQTLEWMAGEVWERGRRRIGIKTLIENLRWNFWLETDDPNSDFKINNDYTSFYARLIIELHPEWEGLFEMRTQHAPSRLVPK